MRNRLVMAAALVCALVWSASPSAADPANVGVTAGVNIGSASLSGTDTLNIDAGKKAGAFVGAFAVWPLGDFIAVQPEVAYSQRHFSTKDTLSGFTATEKWDWIQIPVLARVRVWHQSASGIHLLVGPSFNFRVHAKEDAAGQTTDIKNFVQSSDVSIVAGGGITFGHAGVDVVYDGGLRDLNKDRNLGDDLKVKSRALRVDATWTFR